ncbi:MAG: DUF6088 family protein [Oscillospiraceae bacterium]
MRNGIYSQWLETKIKAIPAGEPFESTQIAQLLETAFGLTAENARTITNNKLKRMADEQQIKRISKGVYYLTKETVFGAVTPDYDRYAVQMLTQDTNGVIGYESGASFLNRIGLSTLIAKDIEIISNGYRKKLPTNCHVIAKKPIVRVTDENYQYLQILDTVSDMRRLHINSPNPKAVVNRTIQSRLLDPIKLLGYARRYYPQAVVLDTVDIITGGDGV